MSHFTTMDFHLSKDDEDNKFASPPATRAASNVNLPLWFSQGHIRDDLAKELQAQLFPNTNVKFLSTMQKPEIGMRTHTGIYTLDGTSFCMTGTVTAVGEEPSIEELSRSDSLLWGLLSEHGSAINNSQADKTPQDKMALISKFIGSVHGQRITSIARLYEMGKGGDGLVPRDALVEIGYKFNDNLYYPWAVESFAILPKVPRPQLLHPSFLPEQTTVADDFSCLFDDEKDEVAVDSKWPQQLAPGSPTTIMMKDVTLTHLLKDELPGDDIFHEEIYEDAFSDM